MESVPNSFVCTVHSTQIIRLEWVKRSPVSHSITPTPHFTASAHLPANWQHFSGILHLYICIFKMSSGRIAVGTELGGTARATVATSQKHTTATLIKCDYCGRAKMHLCQHWYGPQIILVSYHKIISVPILDIFLFSISLSASRSGWVDWVILGALLAVVRLLSYSLVGIDYRAG